MSSNDDREAVRFIKNPLAWVAGAVASFVAVSSAVALDPTGTVATVVVALLDLSTAIFTAASITGFTLAPEIPHIPEREVQIVAIVFGIIVVAQILDRVWDSIKDRVNDD